MKRAIEEVYPDDLGVQNKKYQLVERNSEPNGVLLVNSKLIAKKTHTVSTELEQGFSNAKLFIQANTRNKLDIIGRQMKNLQDLMNDVMMETEESIDLHNVACNFVKKPGHIYHLYERPSSQKYFSMLSPKEWQNHPHNFLGSYRLECDQSWTSAEEIDNKYQGLNYLKEVFTPHTSTLVAAKRLNMDENF